MQYFLTKCDFYTQNSNKKYLIFHHNFDRLFNEYICKKEMFLNDFTKALINYPLP